jgi:hypothetical protein
MGFCAQLDQRGYGTASIYMHASSYLGRQEAAGDDDSKFISTASRATSVGSYLLATG